MGRVIVLFCFVFVSYGLEGEEKVYLHLQSVPSPEIKIKFRNRRMNQKNKLDEVRN